MKKFIATALFPIALICICGCSENVTPTDYGFDFALLAEASALDFTDYEVIPGFGGQNYRRGNDEIFVQYTVSGAPDCLDEWRVTGIRCTDPEVRFFNGLTLADDGEIRLYLESDGFKVATFDSIPVHFEAAKGRVTVRYWQNAEIVITYTATNKKGVDF